MRTEIVDIKSDRQVLEQQSKDIMVQLHASQLECQILKNQSEIENADTIRKKLACYVFFCRIGLFESLFRKTK